MNIVDKIKADPQFYAFEDNHYYRLVSIIEDMVLLIHRMCEVEGIDDLYHKYKPWQRCSDVYRLLNEHK